MPYASHRLAVAIAADTGAGPVDVLDEFAGCYYDTALSASAARLPNLVVAAAPGHPVRQ